jgi:hypothetical protein
MRRDTKSRRTTPPKGSSRSDARRPAANTIDPVEEGIQTLRDLTLTLRRMLGLGTLAE